jgi:hypothetical protein
MNLLAVIPACGGSKGVPRKNICSLLILLSSFPILHVSYGLGALYGLVKFWNRWGEPEHNATLAGA